MSEKILSQTIDKKGVNKILVWQQTILFTPGHSVLNNVKVFQTSNFVIFAPKSYFIIYNSLTLLNP